MRTRAEFAQALAELDLTHVQCAVAFLWYYRRTQEYEERSASELAQDLHDEDFPRPNVTRLAAGLQRSRATVRGARRGSFQIDVRQLATLDEEYYPLIGARQVEVIGAVLPPEMVAGTRQYLEGLVLQINGAYEYGFYDASVVLCRRLMESLIIEAYMSRGRHHEIQTNGVFLTLERLLAHIKADRSVVLSRAAPKTMDEIKHAGDVAAHDRTYITKQVDVDELKGRCRKLIAELLGVSGIRS